MVKFLSGFVGLWLWLCAMPAQAEPFFDPTRPLLGGAAPTVQAASAPLVLQSVLLSPERQAAVISGQNVALGQTIQTYVLRSLDSRRAQLQGPQGRLTLWLVPSTQPAASTASMPLKQGDLK